MAVEDGNLVVRIADRVHYERVPPRGVDRLEYPDGRNDTPDGQESSGSTLAEACAERGVAGTEQHDHESSGLAERQQPDVARRRRVRQQLRLHERIQRHQTDEPQRELVERIEALVCGEQIPYAGDHDSEGKQLLPGPEVLDD